MVAQEGYFPAWPRPKLEDGPGTKLKVTMAGDFGHIAFARQETSDLGCACFPQNLDVDEEQVYHNLDQYDCRLRVVPRQKAVAGFHY